MLVELVTLQNSKRDIKYVMLFTPSVAFNEQRHLLETVALCPAFINKAAFRKVCLLRYTFYSLFREASIQMATKACEDQHDFDDPYGELTGSIHKYALPRTDLVHAVLTETASSSRELTRI